MSDVGIPASASRGSGRYDVLIVGAGPVGLTLAALLRSSARSVLLVERRTDPFPGARAMHLDRLSVELLETVGVRWEGGVDLDELAGVSFDARPYGELLIALGELCPDELAPFAFHQPSLERKLQRLLADSAVEQRTGCEVVGLQPQSDGMRVWLQSRSRVEQVSARFVVGCDGAEGPVRQLAGIPSRAWGGAAHWHAGDHLLASRPTDRLVRHHLGRRPVTVVPGCGRHVRIEHLLWAAHGGRRWSPPCELALAELLGTGVEETIATRCYRFETRLALRPARSAGSAAVLLAGDAAHTVAPFLGQGLGLGLRDAAWLAVLLEPANASPIDVTTAYRRARRGDVLATATQSRAAQLLVERGNDPRRLGRLFAALTKATQTRPGLVHRAALAHRRTPLRSPQDSPSSQG